jgi:hypothetical protein
MLVATLLVSVGVSSARRQRLNSTQQRPPTKEWLFSLPAVRSNVKDLEIINQRIIRSGTELPGVAFEILNKSDRPVMAISISCAKSSISKDGLEDEANPIVIIEPHGTLTAEMSDELVPDFPIVITAATFQDGKEEGDTISKELMQKLRARERARHKRERLEGRRPNQ